MKILRLDLMAFGPFTDVGLDLSNGNAGLHVIYGLNEAGKSSALRAIRNLLYGIPERTSDDFLHPKPKLRIGGQLRHSDGRELSFVRHKARKVNLTKDDGVTPLDADELDQFLGSINEDRFERQFGIDHHELLEGGKGLKFIGGSGLGEMLFGAGMGNIGSVREKQEELQAELDELFRPNGRNQKINKAVLELRDAERQLKDRMLAVGEYDKHASALQKATDERSKLESEKQQLRKQLGRLQRMLSALKLTPRRNQILEELVQVGDSVLLPEDFGQRCRKTVEELRLAEQRTKQTSDEISRLDELVMRIQVPEAVLTHADQIDGLQELLGTHRKAMVDRPRLLGFKQGQEHEAKEILRSLRRPPELARAEDLRIGADEKLRIQNLGTEHRGLTQRVQDTTDMIAQLTNKVGQTRRQLDELRVPAETRELRAILRLTQQEGPLEKQWDDARANLSRVEQQAEKDLASLSLLWRGSLAEVQNMAIPPSETIDRCEKEQDEIRSQIRLLQQQTAEASSAVDDLTAQVDELRGERDVPTETDLAAAREHRDAGWQLIQQEWKQGKVDIAKGAAYVATLGGKRDVSEAYEAWVEHADNIADRLRREADRVAKLSQLIAQQQKQTKRRDDLRERLSKAEATQLRIDGEWSRLWQPAGISPWPPKEMRAWLRRQLDLVRNVETLGAIRATINDLQVRLDASRSAMESALRAVGEIPTSNSSLALLVTRAEHTIEQAEKQEKRRGELQRDLARLQGDLQQAESQRSQAVERLDNWRKQWEAAVGRLGLTADATPPEANAFLAEITDLMTKLREAAGNQDRISGIDRDATQFMAQVKGLAERVAPDLVSLPVEQACEELKVRLTEARALAKERDGYSQSRKREAEKLRQAEDSFQSCRVRLDLLCREANCCREDELSGAEQRSIRRRQLEKERHQTDDQLCELAGGQLLDDFLADVAKANADTFSDEVSALERRITTLDGEISRLDQSIGGEQNELERMNSASGAAESKQDIENRIAQLQADTSQFVVLWLASRVLNESIERYRKKNQSATLARASDLFAQLTVGSFEGVKAETTDESTPYLLGIRAGGKEIVSFHERGDDLGLSGLSDGSRDQLYLALRLAHLEDYLRTHEPLPFIVDDLLLNFDDNRAVAALKVLADLSRKTQVIFFTHHRHLVSLAKSHLPADVLFVHELSR